MLSMTGFGKSYYKDDNIELSIQIKSIKIKKPNELKEFEVMIRNLISEKIRRGKIDFELRLIEKKSNNIKLNNERLKTLKNVINNFDDNLKKSFNLNLTELYDHEIIYKNMEEKSDKFEELLKDTILTAIENHRKSAYNEGKKMASTIKKLILELQDSLKITEDNFPDYKQLKYSKIVSKIEELTKDSLTEEELRRISFETAMYVDKSDITEEVTRLKTHIEAFMRKIDDKKVEKGKKLNFILLEMQREINTLGSKFNYSEVLDEILKMKENIEKCREIVQNVT